jgi:hypothetical protein
LSIDGVMTGTNASVERPWTAKPEWKPGRIVGKNGRELLLFESVIPSGTYRAVWADPQTRLPIRLEMEWFPTVQSDPKIRKNPPTWSACTVTMKRRLRESLNRNRAT